MQLTTASCHKLNPFLAKNIKIMELNNAVLDNIQPIIQQTRISGSQINHDDNSLINGLLCPTSHSYKVKISDENKTHQSFLNNDKSGLGAGGLRFEGEDENEEISKIMNNHKFRETVSPVPKVVFLKSIKQV